jgi:2Fe-2S iron-sulfur cluster binding domain
MTKIQFELDGKQVEAKPGETIWQVAKRRGTEIPHLCYSPAPDYRPDGNCRACMVEIEGERVLAASCKRTPSVGMKVKSASSRAIAAQKMVMELLVADQPARETSHDPGPRGRASPKAAFRRPSVGRPMPAIRRCASISMPASSAGCACAPAARCRSMT